MSFPAYVIFQMSFSELGISKSKEIHVCVTIRTKANLAKISTICFVSGSFLIVFHEQSVHI